MILSKFAVNILHYTAQHLTQSLSIYDVDTYPQAVPMVSSVHTGQSSCYYYLLHIVF